MESTSVTKANNHRGSNRAMTSFILVILGCSTSNAFTLHSASSYAIVKNTLTSSTSLSSAASMNLTPELEEMTSLFAQIPTEKKRYMQLLKIANDLPDAPQEIQTPENKVPGCLSTVFIDCESEMDEARGEEVIKFVGWSDGLLTKGLLALLILGLNGHTAKEIEAVSPEFITISKINQSLTPGRNNGFLNMVAVIKRKARESGSIASEPSSNIITSFEPEDGKPMYNAMMTSLLLVKPIELQLVDNSSQHAGSEESGESHFELKIVSGVFEGLPLEKRHQMVHLILGDTMSKIHALEISALAPSEVEQM